MRSALSVILIVTRLIYRVSSWLLLVSLYQGLFRREGYSDRAVRGKGEHRTRERQSGTDVMKKGVSRARPKRGQRTLQQCQCHTVTALLHSSLAERDASRILRILSEARLKDGTARYLPRANSERESTPD